MAIHLLIRTYLFIDVLHSYMGLAGLALLDANLDGALNLPTQTLLHLRERTIFHQRK